jgi:hypothetical protein
MREKGLELFAQTNNHLDVYDRDDELEVHTELFKGNSDVFIE